MTLCQGDEMVNVSKVTRKDDSPVPRDIARGREPQVASGTRWPLGDRVCSGSQAWSELYSDRGFFCPSN